MMISIWWLLPVALILLAEVGYALLLREWDTRLADIQARVERDCFACVTGASVTCFNSHASILSFCHYHRAHWNLITDLEQKTLGDVVG